MAYTVHEAARLSGVTIKTLYHYHKIGLLVPERVAENGYRYYGDRDLERLQQILFYRALQFPLDQIASAMSGETSRLQCLHAQKELLTARKQRICGMLRTIDKAIDCAGKGVMMRKETMFDGLNEREWEAALRPQQEHLQKEYGYTLDTDVADAAEMNKKADEATAFMAHMADALRRGVRADAQEITGAITRHIAQLRRSGPLDAADFAAQARFLLEDDFHRQMLEGQQTGLSYYICHAAACYAQGKSDG